MSKRTRTVHGTEQSAFTSSVLSNVYAYSKWLDVFSRKCKFLVFSETYFPKLLVRKIMFSISFKPLNDGFLEYLVPYVIFIQIIA